jgi:hypothetical protein
MIFAVRYHLNKDHSRNSKYHLTFCVSFIIYYKRIKKTVSCPSV